MTGGCAAVAASGRSSAARASVRSEITLSSLSPRGAQGSGGGPFGRELANEGDGGERGGGVEGGLVVVIAVVQRAADARPDDPGDSPRREQNSVVYARVLRAPEIGRRSAVDG